MELIDLYYDLVVFILPRSEVKCSTEIVLMQPFGAFKINFSVWYVFNTH